MPTIVNFTIKKDGSGSYTSIKAAVVAQAKDLVAADELHRFTITGTGWNSTTPLSETFIDFNSYTTDATRRVEFIVEVADRHDFTGGSGFVFTIPSSFGFVLRSEFVTLDGFEISNTTGTSGVFNNADSVNTLLKNTIVFNIAGGGAFQGDGENNIHWGYTGQASNTNLFYLNGTATNVTCIQLTGEGGFNGDIGLRDVDCENVALYSDNNAGNDQYFSCTGDYNAANKADSNPPGANSFETMVSGDFVNFAGLDYRSALGGALETSGLGGTFIGGNLETSSGISVTALLNSNYMIEYNMKKNVASQSIGAQMITIADGSDFTGTVAVEVTIDGGTKTAGGGSVTHEGEGYHSYGPTQAETNGNHIAVSFAGTGALTQTIQVYTAFPQTVDNNTKIALIPTTAMRGTDSANTVVPPSVAQFNARTIVSADYFLVADYTAPDNTSITSILADTNELQTNQGNWLTATGFSTSVEVAALNDISVTDILTTQMTESYAGDGTAPTLAQSLFLTMQNLQDFSYTGTTQTVKKLDGSTTAATYTLNDAVTPTSKTRVS
tara:strand:+ start:368 stop:2026 length:1659 start_codon:yes stop_codon:yes gene_type:complete